MGECPFLKCSQKGEHGFFHFYFSEVHHLVAQRPKLGHTLIREYYGVIGSGTHCGKVFVIDLVGSDQKELTLEHPYHMSATQWSEGKEWVLRTLPPSP